MNTESFTSKSSRKSARLGNSTTKSMIAVGAVMFFLLYVTSVGVSASNSTGSVAATIRTSAHTTTVYRTRTVTKTATSTVFVESTTTATSTVTDTSTSTVTTTTTSAVCCQTTTTTVTEPASTTTVTSTVTETPNIQSTSGGFSTGVDDISTVFNNGATDCQLVTTVSTANFGGSADTLFLVVTSGSGIQQTITITSGADVVLYDHTDSGAELQLKVTDTDSTSLSVYYSLTAICPS